MNNLKRVLSLGLAGTMLTGMMAIGANAADFTDADQIVNDEAVNILVALNVVDGKPGGIFDPQGVVTRAEMAKMIAATMNGGNDTTTGTKTNPTFTDIKGHWAESYIEYCADMGIISGRGDGTFDPTGEVTGLEAAKMVLTALGYNATAYQLTGSTWAVRTDELARSADPSLYENLDGVMMAANATRETAAQLIWNGLQNDIIKVKPTTNKSNGELTWEYDTATGTDLLKQRFGATVVKGIFYGNDRNNSISEGEIKVGSYNFPAEMDISNIGEQVKVVYKEATGSPVGPDKKDTIYGVFNTHETIIHTITKNDIQDVDTTNDKIKFGDVKYKYKTTGKVYTNYNAGALMDDSAMSALEKQSGDTIKFICNDDNEIVDAYVVESKIAKVNAVNSEKVTISNGVGALTIEDHDIYDGIAKGDIVVATTLYTGGDALTILEKAEVVSGQVKSFIDNGSATKSVTLTDGTTYKVVNKAAMNDDVHEDAVEYFTDSHIGEDFDLYLVNGYVAAAVKTSEGNSNYAVVIEVSKSGNAGAAINGLQVRVQDAEGKKTVLTVSSDSKKANGDALANQSDIAVNDVVTYSLNKSGEANIQIEGSKTTSAGTEAYKANTKSFNNQKTSSDCVLYYLDGDGNRKVATLRDLGDFIVPASKDLTVIKNSDGEIVAIYAALGFRPAGAADSTIYGIVSAYNGRVSIDDAKYYQYTVDSNGDEYTVNLSLKSINKGDVVYFEPTSDDIYDTVTVISGDVAGSIAVGYVADYSEKDGTLSLTSNKLTKTADDGSTYYVTDDTSVYVYAITKDTKFYFVNQNKDVASSGAVTEMDEIKGTKNVIVVYDSDDNAEVVVFETSNEKDITDNG